MFKLPSWFTQCIRRVSGGALGRLCLMVCGALLAVNASGQTQPTTIQLTSTSYAVSETDGFVRVVLRRFGDLKKTTGIRVATTDGTAVNGIQYVARSANFTFETNISELFFDVTVLDNNVTNATTTFTVNLSGATNGAIAFPSSATVSITDDETGVVGLSSGTLQFSSATYVVTDNEGNVRPANAASYPGALITVVRKNGARGRVLVDYEVADGSAGPLGLYTPLSGTLTLDDYQMSTNFLVPIHQYVNFDIDFFCNSGCWVTNTNGSGYINLCFPLNFDPTFGQFCTNIWTNQAAVFIGDTSGTRPPNEAVIQLPNGPAAQTFGNITAPTFTAILRLSNPRLDPNEDQTLPQPALGPQSQSQLGIVIVDSLTTPEGDPIFNLLGMSIERAHYHANESAGLYQIWVNRDAAQDTPLFRYVVNTTDYAPVGGNHQARTYQTEPGSDYATPFADYIPPGTREWFLARGVPPDQVTVDDAQVQWGITEAKPKPITIPIVQDDLVEFNEDLLVQLFQRNGDSGLLEFPAAAPFNREFSVPIQARLTIDFDNIRFINNDDIFHVSFDTNGVFGAEQPAGAVDRRYNLSGWNDTDPPFNLTPGANAQVLAVAIQDDGKLVLGGEFTSVNTKPSRYIARMTRDGQVDKTFQIGSGANGPVTAVDIQSDGKVLIGGLFSSYQGTLRNGLARLNADGTLDSSFNPGLGADGAVRALKTLRDGKVLIGGEFTSFNGTNIQYFARLNANGSLDSSFNTGSGPDDFVYSIDVYGKPMIIEQTSLEIGQRRERSDTYDVGVNSGTIIVEYDFGSTPDDLRLYYNDQIIFEALPSGPLQGTATITFGPGPIKTSQIRAVMNEGNPGLRVDIGTWQYRLTVLPNTDDRPVIGGAFTSFAGVTRGRVARVNNDGTLDTSFNPGLAIESGVVYSVAKHGSKVVVGGAFSEFDRVSRNNIAQLHANGAIDLTYDPGSGFNDIVYSISVQASGKAILGGRFTEFNTSRRLGMARLNWDGKLDTGFMDTAYNHFAGLPNPYTWQPVNFVNSMATLRVTNTYSTTLVATNQDGTATNIVFNFTRYEDQLFIGGSFEFVGGGNLRDQRLVRENFARIWAGYTPGPGTLSFPSDTYSTDENSPSSFITLNRDNGDLGAVVGDFNTSDLQQGPGVATASLDYTIATGIPTWPTGRTVNNFSRRVSESYRGNNFDEYQVTDQHLSIGPGTNSVAPSVLSSIFVSPIDDNLQEGDEQLQLNLSVRPTTLTLGNESIPLWPALGRSTARLTIIDNDVSPGVIGFAQTKYFVDENGKKAQIQLTRTNGAAGPVSVQFRTISGGTATPGSSSQTPGADYVQIPAKSVSFAAGQTNATVEIDIIDDVAAELDETVNLELFSPSGSPGVALGLKNATLTIVDNDFAAGRLNFVAATNVVDEGAGNMALSLKRAGGSSGAVQVEVSTSDITARNGLDYIGLTNFVVTWNNGETADKQVTIPILDRNVVDGARTFKVTLSNARVSTVLEPNALGNVKETIVQINDNDAYGNLRFSQPAYTVDENGTNAVITIVRVNGTTGNLTVGFEAQGELAIPGVDFKPVENTNYITFVDGQTSASFIVPIIDDTVVDGNKTVSLRLLGQTNDPGGLNLTGTLGAPSTATLTIVDNELENIPAGSLDATFVAEGTDDFIHTVVEQSDGRLLIGGDFTAVNAVLRNRLARLYPDGSIDPSFFAGDGPNATVRTMAVQEDGRILIAGAFTAVGATNRNYIARLVHDGGMDQTFDPGAGANNPVYALMIQSDGKIVIGGDFSAYGPTPRNGVARLNADGKLDTSFNPGSGGSGAHGLTVFALAQQLDGKLLVGGDFESFNNIPANGLVRLNRDGSVDQSFDTSIGANGSVRSIEVQPDGKILVGGLFTHLQGSAKFGFTNALAFGATNLLASATGGNTNLVSVAGDLIFDSGVISLSYDFTNLHNLLIQVGSQTILSTNVQRPGVLTATYPSTAGSGSAVRVVVNDGPQPGGKWSYSGSISGRGASRTNSFPIPAEIGFDSGLVTIDYNFTNKHSVRVVLDSTAGSTNIAYISNLVSSGTLEAKYFATNRSGIRVIVEDQAGLEVSTNAGAFYSLSGTLSRGAAGVARLNPNGAVDTTFNVAAIPDISRRGANGPVNSIKIGTDGKIVVGGDFTTFNGVTRRGVTRLTTDGLNDPTINFGSGTLGSVASVLVQPDRKIVIAGGFTEYNGVKRARIARINGGSIVGSGRFEFAQPLYTASETQTNSLVITVRRTGGTTGTVAMNFSTQDDPTVPALQRAIGGLTVTNQLDDVDYQITAGTLVFPEGETLKTFTVPLKDDTFVEGDEYFQVALSDVPGEPFRLGDQPTAQVLITSDDSEIYFAAAAYSVGESTPSGVASITISRAGSVSSSVSVVLATRDLTATNGLDYVGSTNTITFGPGETNRIIAIPIISDTLVEGNEFVGLTLLNPSAGGQLRPNGNTATLMIVDDDFSPGEIAFADTTYSVIEGQGAVGRVRVVRRNGTFGTATVRYATRGVTAIPGGDYIDQTGVLTFDGETEKFIEIPILNDDISEPNKTVEIRLSNVTGGATLGLDVATLTIVDDDLSSGSLDAGFNPGIGANGPIRALQMAPGRRFLIGGDFTAYNGDTNQSRITRLVEAGPADGAFIQTTNHPNNSVASLVLQPDNKLIIGGSFNSVGLASTSSRRLARLLPDEVVLDPGFALPVGLDGQVSTIALQPDGKVMIGGGFTAASAAERSHIARLTSDGKVDLSFNPGGGADNMVNVVTLQSNGKVLVGGAFNVISGFGAGRIARLNADGSLDSSFRTGVGFTRSDSRPSMVYDIVLLSSGKILVAGDFTSYNNTNCGGIALLDQNGLLQTYTWLDATNGLHTNAFGSELQLNGAVRTVAVEHTDRNSDEKLIIGGDFTLVNDLRQPATGYSRGRIARLDPATGRIDPSFDPGDGANDSVLEIVVQPWNGKVLVAGAFTQFNNNTNLHGIARLNNDKAFVPPTGSTPVTISNSVLVAGQLSITFTGENNVDYVIQGTSELAPNPANTVWTNVKQVVGSGSAATTQIPITGNYRFFRIVAQ